MIMGMGSAAWKKPFYDCIVSRVWIGGGRGLVEAILWVRLPPFANFDEGLGPFSGTWARLILIFVEACPTSTDALVA